MIVRTPEYYNQWYWIIAGSFFVGFFFLHVVMTTKYKQADQLILPIVMLMTGFSILTLLSLQDPLRDRFLAKDTLVFFGIGILSICILLAVNLRKFTTDSRLYRLLIFKSASSKANGWQWAGLALGLLAFTIVLVLVRKVAELRSTYWHTAQRAGQIRHYPIFGRFFCRQ